MSKAIELKATDLNPQGGVLCPNKLAGMQLWDSHPRVFLDLAHNAEVKCPYCGTQYKLKPGEHVGGHH
jgi:Zinc-finger domain